MIYLLKKINKFFLLSLLVVLTSACAIIVSPTGGPQDTTPPKALAYTPGNNTVLFKEREIKIKFDEYIELKNLEKELNIAPRFKHEPDINVVGKNVVIKIKDTLVPDKTYNINFGNAVVDFTEGNVLSDFQYIFSTGNYIDSFTIAGVIIDAYTLKPMEDCHVALYEKEIDSLPLTTLPDYVIKSKKDGSFRFNNIASGRYKLFAVKDANASYTYDLPNEWLGFVDSTVASYFEHVKKTDARVKSDSITDTTQLDTGKMVQQLRQPISIVMFQEKDTVQKLMKVNRMAPLGLQLFFKNPVDTLLLTPLNRNFSHQWYFIEYNATRDSLYCWFVNPGTDSLILQIAGSNKIYDTLELAMFVKASMHRGRGTGLPQKVSFFPNAVSGGAKAYYTPLLLKSNIPLDSCDFSSVILKEDSVIVLPSITFKDEPVKRIVKIDYPWKQKKKYELLIPDSAMFHYSKVTNDTLKLKFTTNGIDDYGVLLLNVQLPQNGNYILELLSAQGDVINSRYINDSGVQKYENVYPAKYGARLILDNNNNRKWDTGNYRKKLQPEKVYIYTGTIDIKANWDLEADWLLKAQIK